MKIISSTLLFVLFTAVLGQNDVPNTTVTTEATTTTVKSTSTTLESTTTTVASTSTSEASTSTSDESTTTIMPTTPSSTTTISSSTTETPITSSSEAPTTKSPPHGKCEFNVTEGDLTCIRAELQAEFKINIEGKEYPVMLGCNATYSGSDCSSSNETQTLVLSEPTYRLTMVFEKVSGKALVKNVTFSYNLPEGPPGIASNSSEDLFNVKVGNSYLCKSKFDIHLENVTMEIQEIHIQAFLEEGKTYGATEECEADEKVSDIVPIAVGVALAALIIIVLIAYLVGRRRSRQKGYQSV